MGLLYQPPAAFVLKAEIVTSNISVSRTTYKMYKQAGNERMEEATKKLL